VWRATAKHWDWLRAVQTKYFAIDAPLSEDDGRYWDDEADFELEPDELELLKKEAEEPLPQPSVGDSNSADAMTIDKPSTTSVDDDQEDDQDDYQNDDQPEEMELVVANVEDELDYLQACRLLIESRLQQLAILEPTYWRSRRHSRTNEPWREDQIAQILSIVKKACVSSIIAGRGGETHS
jgi:hypothetical protein